MKESIAILIIMFFEGPRLLPLEEFNKELLGQLSTKKALGADNKKLIGSWCNDSRDFYADQNGVMKVVVSRETSDAVKKAATNLRIMCRSKWDTWVERSPMQDSEVQASGGKISRGESSTKGRSM